jgi:hypothetical protein
MILVPGGRSTYTCLASSDVLWDRKYSFHKLDDRSEERPDRALIDVLEKGRISI